MPVLTVLLFLISQSDSVGLLSHARHAQADFERTRLVLLPTGVPRSGGQCDARIGRFCYWSDEGGSHPRVEPTAIGLERARLLALLDSVALALPGDPWVAGQRVRYLLEAGRPRDAADAAQACRAEAWWCAALEGLVLHVTGEFAAAESVFQTMLDWMPPEQRCRWRDVSDLLDEPLRRRYERLSCGERTGFESHVWWLAQPLWSLAGNDRRTEHYARLTLTRLLEDARSPYGFWGDDQRELVVRYGWPLVWERDDGGGTRQAVAIGHEPEPSYHFFPDGPAFDAIAPAGDVAALDRKPARERYAPAYAATFSLLPASFAAFRRGESTLVVGSYDVTEDTLFQDPGREVALVLAHDEWSPPVIARRSGAERSGVLVAEAPWDPAWLSLELLARERHAAGRARTLVPARAPSLGAVTLSGILLFEPGDSLPADLSAALTRAHSGGVRPGARIGLYWEAYGLASGEDVGTAVTVTAEREGWLRRVAAALRLGPRSGSIRVEWREAAQVEQGRAARALVLDLSGLAAGRYRIAVTLSPQGRAPATVARGIAVIEP